MSFWKRVWNVVNPVEHFKSAWNITARPWEHLTGLDLTYSKADFKNPVLQLMEKVDPVTSKIGVVLVGSYFGAGAVVAPLVAGGGVKGIVDKVKASSNPESSITIGNNSNGLGDFDLENPSTINANLGWVLIGVLILVYFGTQYNNN